MNAKTISYILTLCLFVSCGKSNTNSMSANDANATNNHEVSNHLDDISVNLSADMRRYVNYIIALDYDKVYDYMYPGFLEDIHKVVPELTDEEFKAKMISLFPEMYNKSFMRYKPQSMPEATRFNSFFYRIEKKLHSDNKYLVTYSRICYYYNDTDSVKRDELDYGLAVSLDDGINWYFIDAGIEDCKSALLKDFSNREIEYVLTKDD